MHLTRRAFVQGLAALPLTAGITPLARATVSHMRLPPASCDHTPFTSGTPAASSWFHTAPQR